MDIKTKHKSTERNEPTPEQLDRTADANGITDFYREVDLDEQKHLDWRRKLGGMLARDLGYSDPEKGYILAAFPENYRLYEHVKRAEDESKNKTVKNHAGGGNERQDAYLYGHPVGRKKRFRSPNDFYPHLFWLATDEEGDPDNCACKICCPEEIDDKPLAQSKKEPKQEPKQEAKPELKQDPKQDLRQETKQEPKPAQKPIATAKTEPLQKPPPLAVSTKQLQQEVNPQQSRPSSTLTPTVPTQVLSASSVITNEDQRTDLMPGGFMFRQGELVWFSRGPAWGLGVLAQRWKQNAIPNYTVQPLSHPFNHPQALSLVGDHSLRPWLAWSVPDFTCSALIGLGFTYQTADWAGLSNGRYGSGDLEVDGSILAATSIDLSYTPFEKVSTQPLPNNILDTAYNGLYFGAERLWRGDIVRLKSGNGTEIMVISAIIERATTSAFNQQIVSPTLMLQGAVYALRKSAPSIPLDLSMLPTKLVGDLMRRNAATLAHKGFATTYVRTHASLSSVDMKDVKGRWYEATLLGPVMLGTSQADQELARGELGEMGTRMNARLDCQKIPDYVQKRTADRHEAFGNAVPLNFRLVDASVSTTQVTGHPITGAGYNTPGVGALDEFMNLDG